MGRRASNQSSHPTHFSAPTPLDPQQREPFLRQGSPQPSQVPSVANHSKHLLRVGDLAKATGKTVRAIHLYEEMGLLRPSERSKGRYRLFGPDALVRIRWIVKLQELGWSLSEIQTVVRASENLSAPGAMTRMRRVYERQLEATRERIARLQALEQELVDSLEYLSRCDTCHVDLKTACRSCQLSHEQQPPELVAGLSAQ